MPSKLLNFFTINQELRYKGITSIFIRDFSAKIVGHLIQRRKIDGRDCAIFVGNDPTISQFFARHISIVASRCIHVSPQNAPNSRLIPTVRWSHVSCFVSQMMRLNRDRQILLIPWNAHVSGWWSGRSESTRSTLLNYRDRIRQSTQYYYLGPLTSGPITSVARRPSRHLGTTEASGRLAWPCHTSALCHISTTQASRHVSHATPRQPAVTAGN